MGRGCEYKETGQKGETDGKIYVFAAQGCEEIECLTQVDLLRRAGLEVVLCAVGGALRTRGSHGITFEADAKIEEDAVLRTRARWSFREACREP